MWDTPAMKLMTRSNARQEAADEGGRRSPALEEVFGLVDLVLADEQEPAPAIEERPAELGPRA
jgi:hypothetical protein